MNDLRFFFSYKLVGFFGKLLNLLSPMYISNAHFYFSSLLFLNKELQ